MTPPDQTAPRVAWPLRVGVAATAALAGVSSTPELGLWAWTLVSPLTPTLGRDDFAGRGFTALLCFASTAVLLRRRWAHLLLAGLVAARATALVSTMASVVSGANALGVVIFGAAILASAGAVVSLIAVARRAPDIPTSCSRRRVALVLLGQAALFLLALGAAAAPAIVAAPPTDPATFPERPAPSLRPLLEHSRWVGERLRVVGAKGDQVLTERTASWFVRADAGPDGLVTLAGFRFSERLRLAVDLRRSLLVVQDEVLVGRPIEGTSPMFGPFAGVTFEAEGWGRVAGQASILALADGRLAFDFDHLEVDGRRTREYGAVAPEKR